MIKGRYGIIAHVAALWGKERYLKMGIKLFMLWPIFSDDGVLAQPESEKTGHLWLFYAARRRSKMAPRVLTTTNSMGTLALAASIPFLTIMGRPEQQGTSMTMVVTRLIPATLKISANLAIYSSTWSNFGHPTITVLPSRKSWCKEGNANGTQSATTSKSAPFKNGALGGIKRICTGQWDSADAASP